MAYCTRFTLPLHFYIYTLPVFGHFALHILILFRLTLAYCTQFTFPLPSYSFSTILRLLATFKSAKVKVMTFYGYGEMCVDLATSPLSCHPPPPPSSRPSPSPSCIKGQNSILCTLEFFLSRYTFP